MRQVWLRGANTGATMDATSLPSNEPAISEIAFRHLRLGCLYFLCWHGGNFIIDPVPQGHVQLILAILFEIPIMVVTALMFGDRSVTRDINEINGYALLAHLIYLPVYFLGVSPVYHNNAINLLGCFAVVRLLYFGPRTPDGDLQGLPIFGLLGHARQWWRAQDRAAQFDAYLPAILFFGAAIPLWGGMVRVHDLWITSMLAVLMSFIFFISKHLHTRLFALQNQAATARAALVDEQAAHTATASALATCRAELAASQNHLRQLQAQLARYSGNTTLPALYAHANLLASLPDHIDPQAQEVARQWVAKWQETHPAMRNLQGVLVQYMACQFPADSVFAPQSIAYRTAKAMRELAELLFIAKEQVNLLETEGLVAVDVEFLPTNNLHAPLFDIDTMAVKSFMTYVLLVPHASLTNRTLIMTCEMLTTALLRMLLSQCSTEYLQDFPELEELTQKFVARHIPLVAEAAGGDDE